MTLLGSNNPVCISSKQGRGADRIWLWSQVRPYGVECFQSKHPLVVIPSVDTLAQYASTPAMTPLDITGVTDARVLSKRSGWARRCRHTGTAALDAALCEGESKPPRQSRRSGRLTCQWGRTMGGIPCPWLLWINVRVYLVGIRETWRRLLAKYVISIVEQSTKLVCGMDQQHHPYVPSRQGGRYRDTSTQHHGQSLPPSILKRHRPSHPLPHNRFLPFT